MSPSRYPPIGEPKHHYRGYPIHKGYNDAWDAYTLSGVLICSGKTLEQVKAGLDSFERMRIPGDKRIP